MAEPAEHTETTERLRITIAIASAGRRDILAAVLPYIARQTRLPDEIVIGVPFEDDVDRDSIKTLPCPARVILSRRGLCVQRNAILDALDRTAIVFFLDDDFIMAPDYLEEAERVLLQHPDIVLLTGTVIADGITGPGLPLDDALRLTEQISESESESPNFREVYNGYGCNMAIRMSAVRDGNIRFDENLPLYGWLEDVDFSRRLARHGRLVRSRRAAGVHLGTKSGRISGVRFGYSQIANPVYLLRKRTMSLRHATVQIGRNLAANIVRVWAPEPWVDRRGRLRGNLKACTDLFRGRLAPRNIEQLE
jgi:polysaccharide biosynthesis transport protein